MSKSGSTFIAFLAGAAIGAGIGTLYAPESGEDTRKKIGDNARKAQDNLNKQYRETSSTLSKKMREAKGDFEVRLEETLSSASYKAEDILTALESRLEELKKQNSKFQKEVASETKKGASGKATA